MSLEVLPIIGGCLGPKSVFTAIDHNTVEHSYTQFMQRCFAVEQQTNTFMEGMVSLNHLIICCSKLGMMTPKSLHSFKCTLLVQLASRASMHC